MGFFHYGDDFVIEGRREDAYWLKGEFDKELILKDRGCIGQREDDCKEITMLHRIIRYDREADVIDRQVPLRVTTGNHDSSPASRHQRACGVAPRQCYT